MKAKHTPVPWKFDGKTDIYGPDGGTICAFHRNAHEYQMADINLIAAAPDLLDALEKIMIDPNFDWDIARAAIAKAKG